MRLNPLLSNIKSPIVKFFYKLGNSERPDWKTASDKERLSYLFKCYSAIGFFKLSNKYHKFIGWLTQYYPFSLLYRDRLFHHKNLKNINLMLKIEALAKKVGLDIMILNGQIENQIVEFSGYFRKKAKPDAINILEKVLQKKYGTVYVRADKTEVRILFPVAIFKRIVNRG